MDVPSNVSMLFFRKVLFDELNLSGKDNVPPLVIYIVHQQGLPNEVRRRLRRYLETYRKGAENDEPVFASRYHQPLSTKGIDMLFDRLARWGKIEGVRCSAHTCRHTFAVNYLRNGGDIYRLSILMGHSSVKVTEVYLKTFQAEEARKTPNTKQRRSSR